MLLTLTFVGSSVCRFPVLLSVAYDAYLYYANLPRSRTNIFARASSRSWSL
jgi:hypothetical protein